VPYVKPECGPMPNVMAALLNIGGAFCSTPQSLADTQEPPKMYMTFAVLERWLLQLRETDSSFVL